MFEQQRQKYVDRAGRGVAGSAEARSYYTQLALPRVMVVWFNAWECTSAQDTWARCG